MYQHLLAFALATIVFLIGMVIYLEYKDASRNKLWDCVMNAATEAHYAGDIQQAWGTFGPMCAQ